MSAATQWAVEVENEELRKEVTALREALKMSQTHSPLTKRQREVMDFLTAAISKSGYAPSLVEIGQHLGLSSLATVHKHLSNLETKGCIVRRWNRSRSIEIVGAAA